jgi:hypothetical protein
VKLQHLLAADACQAERSSPHQVAIRLSEGYAGTEAKVAVIAARHSVAHLGSLETPMNAKHSHPPTGRVPYSRINRQSVQPLALAWVAVFVMAVAWADQPLAVAPQPKARSTWPQA